MYEKILKDSAASIKAHQTMRGGKSSSASSGMGKDANGKPRSFTAAEMTHYNTRHSRKKKTDTNKMGSIAATLGLT